MVGMLMYNKKYIISIFKIFLFLLPLFSNAQSFEGKVVYKNIYKSKSERVTEQQLQIMMGVTQDYYIKAGNYKTIYSGKYFEYQLYSNKENKLFTKFSMRNILFYNDGKERSEKIVEHKINKEATKILGLPCDEIIIKTTKGVYKYYYNTKYKIDVNQFKNHLFGNWSFYTSKTEAIPLKMIIDNNMFIVESTAIKVENLKLDDSIFIKPNLEEQPSSELKNQ